MSKLTHWGRVTHICVSKLTIIGSDNGLSPGRRQAIIWANAGILSIGPLGTNLNEILIEIHPFPFKKMRLKISSAKWRPFCLGLNVLNVFVALLVGTVMHVGLQHFSDVIMSTMASQITSVAIAYSSVYSGADKKTSTLRITGLCEENSPATVTRKMFPFNDVIMNRGIIGLGNCLIFS